LSDHLNAGLLLNLPVKKNAHDSAFDTVMKL